MQNYSTLRKLARMVKELRNEARRMKMSNPVGAKDRWSLADQYETRALVLAGRVQLNG